LNENKIEKTTWRVLKAIAWMVGVGNGRFANRHYGGLFG
jgi:hypothetical protein